MTKIHGMFVVKTKEELDLVTESRPIWVVAVCPKCKREWTSIPVNAEKVLELGCLLCTDAWEPSLGMIDLDEKTVA